MPPRSQRSRSGALGRNARTSSPVQQQHSPSDTPSTTDRAANGRHPQSRAVRGDDPSSPQKRTQSKNRGESRVDVDSRAKDSSSPAAATRADPASNPSLVGQKVKGTGKSPSSASAARTTVTPEQARYNSLRDALALCLIPPLPAPPLPHVRPIKLQDISQAFSACTEDASLPSSPYVPYVTDTLQQLSTAMLAQHTQACYHVVEAYATYILDQGWLEPEALAPIYWCRMPTCPAHFPTMSELIAHQVPVHKSWVTASATRAIRTDPDVCQRRAHIRALEEQLAKEQADLDLALASRRAATEHALLDPPIPERVFVTPAYAAVTGLLPHVDRALNQTPPHPQPTRLARFQLPAQRPTMDGFATSATAQDTRGFARPPSEHAGNHTPQQAPLHAEILSLQEQLRVQQSQMDRALREQQTQMDRALREQQEAARREAAQREAVQREAEIRMRQKEAEVEHARAQSAAQSELFSRQMAEMQRQIQQLQLDKEAAVAACHQQQAAGPSPSTPHASPDTPVPPSPNHPSQMGSDQSASHTPVPTARRPVGRPPRASARTLDPSEVSPTRTRSPSSRGTRLTQTLLAGLGGKPSVRGPGSVAGSVHSQSSVGTRRSRRERDEDDSEEDEGLHASTPVDTCLASPPATDTHSREQTQVRRQDDSQSCVHSAREPSTPQ